MSNLKPVAYYLTATCGDEELITATEYDEYDYYRDKHMYDLNNTPLYAIPEGYHIVPIAPITPDQAMISNIELHNEPLREKGDE